VDVSQLGLGARDATYNATLQVVARAAEEDFLLDDLLFGRHSGNSSFAVGTKRDVEEGAIKHWLSGKSRASCCDVKRGGRSEEK